MIEEWPDHFRWDYEELASEGYNALAAFEIVLINLRIINEDYVSDIEETERFDQIFSRKRRNNGH